MANPTGRVLPVHWDEYSYAPLFTNLRKIGYEREMGVEATSTDFTKEAPESLAFLRAALAPLMTPRAATRYNRNRNLRIHAAEKRPHGSRAHHGI
jgi:hypothetical protein